jgi:membrane protein YqaA with SNARE-associated domain
VQPEFGNFSTPLLAIVSTFLITVAGGLFPLISIELLVLFLASVFTSKFLVLLVLAATAGQMTGKIAIYVAGRFIDRVPSEWIKRKVAALQSRAAGHPALGHSLVATSAVASIPPFHLVAVATGSLRYPFGWFLLIGFSGRLLRFGLLAAAPQLVRGWLF